MHCSPSGDRHALALSLKVYGRPDCPFPLGACQGTMAIVFCGMINTSYSPIRSWPTACKKALLGLSMTPLFFLVNTAIVESIKECSLCTIVPKFRQVSPPPCLAVHSRGVCVRGGRGISSRWRWHHLLPPVPLPVGSERLSVRAGSSVSTDPLHPLGAVPLCIPFGW